MGVPPSSHMLPTAFCFIVGFLLRLFIRGIMVGTFLISILTCCMSHGYHIWDREKRKRENYTYLQVYSFQVLCRFSVENFCEGYGNSRYRSAGCRKSSRSFLLVRPVDCSSFGSVRLK